MKRLVFPIVVFASILILSASFQMRPNEVETIGQSQSDYLSLQVGDNWSIMAYEDTTKETPVNFMVVDVKPIYPGCKKKKSPAEQYQCFQEKLAEHIQKTFRYPPIAKDLGIQGKVFVSFQVDIKGYITNINVVKSVNEYLDAEAVRIIGLLPRMKPAKQRGKSVPVTFTCPINFKLQ